MLDLRFIRENANLVRDGLRKKRVAISVDEVLSLDEERRRVLHEGEVLKAERNKASEEIATAKRAGQDATAKIAAMREVGDRIKALDAELRDLEAKSEALLLRGSRTCRTRRSPTASAPRTTSAVRHGGPEVAFEFPALAHWEIADPLGCSTSTRAAKIARLAASRSSPARGARLSAR